MTAPHTSRQAPPSIATDDDVVADLRQRLIVTPDASRFAADVADGEHAWCHLASVAARARVACLLAMALVRRGDVDGARRWTASALALAADTPSVHRECAYSDAVVLALGGLRDQALVALEALHAILDDDPSEDALRARVLNALGNLYSYKGRIDDSMRIHEENIRVRERLGDPEALAIAYYNYAELWKRLDDEAAAYEYYKRCHAIESLHNLTGNIVQSAGCLAIICARRRDTAAAERYAADAVAAAASTGVPYLRSTALLYQAETYQVLGDRPAQRDALIASMALARDHGLTTLLLSQLTTLAQISVEEGALDAARRQLDEAETLMAGQDFTYERLTASTTRLTWLRHMGQHAALRELARTLIPDLIAHAQHAMLQMAMLECARSFVDDPPTRDDFALHAAWMAEWQRLGSDHLRERLLAARTRFMLERSAHETQVFQLRSFELGNVNRQLERSLSELQRLSDDKDDLLAVVAHDLREPLHTVRALLGRDPSADDRALARELVDRSLTTVQRLLDLGRRTPDMAVQPVDCQLMLERAAERHRSTAVQRSISLIVVQATTQLWAASDAGIIEVILDNLCSNALKFTPGNGAVTLAATASADGIAIVVTDTGVGVADADVDHLFTKYGRFGQPEQGPGTSLGLGLYLSQRLAQRAGGTITYERGPNGTGSRFTLLLAAHHDAGTPA